MKKYIMFGGFDYALRWEMDQDAVFRGIDYFVDNDTSLVGTTYLGKPVYAPEKLQEENKDEILILIGSVIYRTEIAFQLKEMGFEEDKDFVWAVGFCGDEKCPKLWKYVEWKDREQNQMNLKAIEEGEYALSRLKIVSELIERGGKYTRVVDFGAANGRIEKFLDDNIDYTPVDYIRYSDKTVICDLNKGEFPDIDTSKKETCMLSIGCIQYISNWKLFLKQVSEHCDCFICAHNDFVRANREYRRTHYNWNNAIFNHEIMIEMQKLGFHMTEAYDFRLRTVIMKFERLCR